MTLLATIFEDWTTLGRLHVLLLHLPIGLGFGLALLELVIRPRREPSGRGPVQALLWIWLVSCILTIAFGLILEEHGTYGEEVVDHRILGIILAPAIFMLALVHHFARVDASKKMLDGYRAGLVIVLVLTVVVGHLGGRITHGEDYLAELFFEPDEGELPQYVELEEPSVSEPESAEVLPAEDRTLGVVQAAPAKSVKGPAIRSVQQEPARESAKKAESKPSAQKAKAAKTSAKKPSAQTKGPTYAQIRPILEDRCYRCHGPKKQKGKYRLDRRAPAFAGGDSGEIAIVPGEPAASEFIRRILLPKDDDDAMPPKGKPDLSRNQVRLLQDWVLHGAHWEEEGTAQGGDDEASMMMAPAASTASTTPTDRKREIYQPQVSDQTEALLAQLQALNLRVEPTLWGDESLLVDVSRTASPDWKAIAQALAPVSERVGWLDLGGCELPDDFKRQLGSFSKLRRLDLSATNFGNADIRQLESLAQLEHLNLRETKVSNRSLRELERLGSLRQLILYKSKVTEGGADQLRKKLSFADIVL